MHEYLYDLLGRLQHDCVTTFAAGVDTFVQRIELTYEVRGMVESILSYNSPIVGSGSVLNQVYWVFNNLRQPIQTIQSHFGPASTSTTALVQIEYATPTSTFNSARPTSMYYPNGRQVTYNYGTSGGITDSASQVASLIDNDGTTHLADYSYLGLGTIVQQNSSQANLSNTLINPAGTNDPVTGDIYSGLDLFGRVKDSRCRNTSTGSDLSRVQYGYNRSSSRIWRANPTDPSTHHDWLYNYDGLQRVANGTRGTLNGTQTAITSPQFAECWTLDSTGNWKNYRQDNTGGGTWTMNQTRTANAVNEITSLTDSVSGFSAAPIYDANGNVTANPTLNLTNLTWPTLTPDQWYTLSPDQWAGLGAYPGTTFTYDAWNRLATVTDGTNGNLIQQNRYDGRNYRILAYNYTNGVLAEDRNYYYTDDWQCVEERFGTLPDTQPPERQFVWGLQYVDNLVCRDRAPSGTGSLTERFYACQDANWNMTAIVDTTGTVQERYEYDPYGTPTFLTSAFSVLSASAYAWETTYAGYRWDSGSAQYAVRNRFYQSATGIWLTRDPIGYVGTMNLYQLGSGGPLNEIDPYGLLARDALNSLIDRLYLTDQLKEQVGWVNLDEADRDQVKAAVQLVKQTLIRRYGSALPPRQSFDKTTVDWTRRDDYALAQLFSKSGRNASSKNALNVLKCGQLSNAITKALQANKRLAGALSLDEALIAAWVIKESSRDASNSPYGSTSGRSTAIGLLQITKRTYNDYAKRGLLKDLPPDWNEQFLRRPDMNLIVALRILEGKDGRSLADKLGGYYGKTEAENNAYANSIIRAAQRLRDLLAGRDLSSLSEDEFEKIAADVDAVVRGK